MTIVNIIKELILISDRSEEQYFDIVHAISLLFPKRLIEQLTQLVNGPVYDGDIISKSGRDELFDMGLAVRVCSKGGQGYTGSKYIGCSILRGLEKIRKENK